ncbi:hypothetical protein IM40_10755 (plasmid) [Candidatus Paracaedimonas acanthamoebae]|nr:hypothetical protein IM40_10755 [Candidatus Paracaedimonas acanthamoebae]
MSHYFFIDKITAGFPSPASDYLESSLDLNEYLITNPVATFFLRATTDAMRESGIFSGDMLIVDRSLKPKSNDIVVVELEGDLSVRRYERLGKKITLSTDSPYIEPIYLSTVFDFTIWGVVKAAIHTL